MPVGERPVASRVGAGSGTPRVRGEGVPAVGALARRRHRPGGEAVELVRVVGAVARLDGPARPVVGAPGPSVGVGAVEGAADRTLVVLQGVAQVIAPGAALVAAARRDDEAVVLALDAPAEVGHLRVGPRV